MPKTQGNESFLRHPVLSSVCPDLCSHLLTKGYDFLPHHPSQVLEFSQSQPSPTLCSLDAPIFTWIGVSVRDHLFSLFPCWHLTHDSSLNVLEVWGLRLCEINHISNCFGSFKGKRNRRIPGIEATFPKELILLILLAYFRLYFYSSLPTLKMYLSILLFNW